MRFDLDTVDGLAEAAFDDVPSFSRTPYLVVVEDGKRVTAGSGLLEIEKELTCV